MWSVERSVSFWPFGALAYAGVRADLDIESTDPEYNEYERKFAAVEAASEKMLKDSTIFRDSVQGESSVIVHTRRC